MPWEECTPVDRRGELVMQVRSGVGNMTALCRKYGVSRKTGYKWLRRYEEHGSLFDLYDRSRRPLNSPSQVGEELESLIVAIRQEEGWGARKIGYLLAQDGREVSEATINRVIKRQGLVPRADKHRPALQRFEYEAPNELWQIDLKGPIRLQDKGQCVPLTILDDHSRYLVGLFALESTMAEPIMACLKQTWEQFGLPEAILTDHGIPFWSTTSPRGITRVDVLLQEQGITHRLSGIHHPQTQGKVERLHLTLQEAMNHHGTPRTMQACQDFFDRFRGTYNRRRPHEALGMAVPADRYRPSDRPFQEPPPAWLYPSQMTVRTLNTAGCLDYEGQRLFVCEALARQQVGLFEFEGQLYVHYRALPIRQITLDTRATRAPHV